MSDTPTRFSRTVEFKVGSVALHDDGTATFHFRGMEYVYLSGVDRDDGMRITLDKETAEAIKALYRKESGY